MEYKAYCKGYRFSVNAGIDMLKEIQAAYLMAANLVKEMENYKWMEDKNGNLLNKPEDKYNHAY